MKHVIAYTLICALMISPVHAMMGSGTGADPVEMESPRPVAPPPSPSNKPFSQQPATSPAQVLVNRMEETVALPRTEPQTPFTARLRTMKRNCFTCVACCLEVNQGWWAVTSVISSVLAGVSSSIAGVFSARTSLMTNSTDISEAVDTSRWAFGFDMAAAALTGLSAITAFLVWYASKRLPQLARAGYVV